MRAAVRKVRTLVVGVALVAAAVSTGQPAQGAPGGPARHAPRAHERTFASGSVLVAFRPATPAAERSRLLRLAGARPSHHLAGPRAERVVVAAGTEEAAVAVLRAQAAVRYAEPDYLSVPTSTPNDPSFGQQWAAQNTGQTVAGITGSPGADANVVPAWASTTGSASVVVAVVDTGVDYTHPDLAANVWTNNAGVGGCPAGTHGYNVLNVSCDPMDDDTSYGGHGTHVAGIIGAAGNNGIGVAGVNWTTSILPVKWIGSSGTGATSDLVRALDWVLLAKAAGVNVRVVNDSNVFVGTAFSQALADEIDLLAAKDILFVTAAGSTGADNDDPALRRYPCGYARDNELCATWTDQSDRLASSSSGFGSANYGATSVDLAAPGDNIYSTTRGGSYNYLSGGSMAAAEVSGAAALVLSKQTLTAVDLKADLLEHVHPLASLTGKVRSGGRLDICAAIAACAPTAVGSPPPYPVTQPAVTGAQTQPGHPSPEPQVGQALSAGTGRWDFVPSSFGYQWSSCTATGGACVPLSGATQTSYVPVAGDVGKTLRMTVTATNGNGSTTSSSVPTMVVQAAPPTGTFGKTAVASTADPADADYERLDAVTVPNAGKLGSLSVYLAPAAAGSQTVRGVVHADAGGSPGALLGVTSDVTVSSTAGSGWVTLPFGSALAVDAGPAWIGVQFGPSSRVFSLRYDESTANSGAVSYAAFASGPLGTSSSWRLQAEQISLYASYAVPVTVPTLLTPPAISGSTRRGKTLTASTGTWTGSPTSYAYRWFRCGSSGCSVAATSGSTYLLVQADVGYKMQVQVTASNSAGPGAPAQSALTKTVTNR